MRSICWRASLLYRPLGFANQDNFAMNRSRSIVSVHTAKVNLRSIIFRMATIIVATLTPLVASAQMNPLVGTWLATIHASDGSTHTQRVTYYADGKWFAETANPPLPNGSGAGVVRTYGRYRLENQTTLHVIYGNTFLCPAGSGCAPYPGNMLAQCIIRQERRRCSTFSFREATGL